MKVLIVSGNPKTDGLCQSVIEAVMAGAGEAQASVEEIRLCDMQLVRCAVCNDGWGICREQHICVYGNDGFEAVGDKIESADAIVIATPVYWGEVTETLKCFLDRFRRCNFGISGRISAKQVLLIASAGGSGNGIVSCLKQLESFCQHTGAVVFDFIAVNRWNSDYKRVAAYEAAKALADGRKNGDTV